VTLLCEDFISYQQPPCVVSSRLSWWRFHGHTFGGGG
jgi:hypothetical protein